MQSTYKLGTTEPNPQDQVNSNFSYQLLTCQMEFDVQQKPDMAIGERLFELYMIGIEFYDAQQDPRAKYFKKKLQALKSSLKYIKLLEERAQSNHKQFNQLRRHRLDLKFKQAPSSKQTINYMLQQQEQERHKLLNSIDHQVSFQKKLLEKRIFSKRLKMQMAETSRR